MVGLSSEAVSKSISKQAEEYRKAIEAGENAAEELVRLEEWKRDQIQRASREAMDGAQVALRDYHVGGLESGQVNERRFPWPVLRHGFRLEIGMGADDRRRAKVSPVFVPLRVRIILPI